MSWKEKGILAYLLSKPTGWNVSVKDIENNATDGRIAVSSALNRLIELGYARRYKIRDESGQIKGWRYDISDTPAFSYLAKNPESENPEVENQLVDDPLTENALHSKKEGSKNNILKDTSEAPEELSLDLDPPPKVAMKDKFPWAQVCAIFKHHRPDKPYRSNPRGRTDRAVKKFYRNQGKSMDCFDKLCEALAESDYLNGRNGFEGKAHPNCLKPNWSWVFGQNSDGDGIRADDILNGKYSNENMAWLLEKAEKERKEEAIVIGRGKMVIDPESSKYEYAGECEFTGLKKYMEV